MSQFYYKKDYNGFARDVMFGWDRPLKHFFATIFLHEDEPGEDEVVGTYDNSSFENVSTWLSKQGYTIPNILEARELVEKKEGNVTYNYKNGAWK